jgi:hypothetical protein
MQEIKKYRKNKEEWSFTALCTVCGFCFSLPIGRKLASPINVFFAIQILFHYNEKILVIISF